MKFPWVDDYSFFLGGAIAHVVVGLGLLWHHWVPAVVVLAFTIYWAIPAFGALKRRTSVTRQ